jgi:hypothetical protein
MVIIGITKLPEITNTKGRGKDLNRTPARAILSLWTKIYATYQQCKGGGRSKHQNQTKLISTLRRSQLYNCRIGEFDMF